MMRTYLSDYRKKHGQKYPDLYPVEILRRVERPTTIILDDKVPQLDEREGGFSRAGRGDFGEQIAKEYRRLGAWGDDLLGYGKPKQENKWWLDLEFVDTEFKFPENID